MLTTAKIVKKYFTSDHRFMKKPSTPFGVLGPLVGESGIASSPSEIIHHCVGIGIGP